MGLLYLLGEKKKNEKKKKKNNTRMKGIWLFSVTWNSKKKKQT